MIGAITHVAWENSDAIVLARIYVDVSNTATALTQARTSTITGKIARQSSGEQVGSDISVTVSTAIYDTLQTGSIWDEDAIGFNFKYRIDGATYFDEAEVYDFAFTIVLASSAGTVVVAGTIDARGNKATRLT